MASTETEAVVPRFDVVPSEVGAPTLRAYRGTQATWVHSRIDPIKEGEQLAARWVRGRGLYLILGLGLGYHITALRDMLEDGSRILVIEPRAELIKLATEIGPSSLGFPSTVPVTILGPSDQASWRVSIGTALGDLMSVPVHVWRHPVLANVCKEDYQEVIGIVTERMNQVLVNANTLSYWGLTWTRNSLENLPFAIESAGISHVAGQFQGLPAYVVAAGPSLDENLPLLRRAQESGVLIAVGTALRPLVGAGVSPHLIVSLDGGQVNALHSKGLGAATKDSVLAFDPMVHPDVPREHAGKRMLLNVGNPLLQWLGWARKGWPVVMASGSVATAATDLAVKMGCNPVIFVGLDLAYSRSRTHAKGTIFDGETVPPSSSAGLVSVPSGDGGSVLSSSSLQSFRSWFEDYISLAPSELRFINTSRSGALIRGTSLARLKDSLKEFGVPDAQARERLLDSLSVSSRWIDPTTLTERLSLAKSKLQAIARDMRVAARLTGDLTNDRYTSRHRQGVIQRLAALDDHLRLLDRELLQMIAGGALREALAITHGESDEQVRREAAPDPPRGLLTKSRDLYGALAKNASEVAKMLGTSLEHLG